MDLNERGDRVGLRHQVFARAPLPGHASDQLAFAMRDARGRRRVARVLLEHLTWAVGLSQLAIWSMNVDRHQTTVVTVVCTLCLVPAVMRLLPPRLVAGEIGRPRRRATFVVCVGDLLSAELRSNDRIVIGISDRVDNGFPDRVSGNTLVGQLSDRCKIPLDQIHRDLWGSETTNQQLRPLPIGSISEVSGTNVMLVVFAKLQDHGSTMSAPVDLMSALGRLWSKVREDNIETVHMPLIGSGYGGADLPRTALLSLIISSFVFAHETAPVCDQVTLYIIETDYEPADFAHASTVLQSFE